MSTRHFTAAFIVGTSIAGAGALGQAFGPRELTEQTKACAACHKEHGPALYQQWGESKHFGANVGCFECHGANKDEPDAFEHYGQIIATPVTPKDCGRCHSKEAEEFTNSRHSKAGRILGSLDNVLAEVVEGNKGMKSVGAPQGVSAAAVSGCWQCHGTEIKVLAEGKLDPTTWPNSGVGRINPDGSEGTCNACHSRHSFSIAQARHPNTCGKCHLGPDHPQKEIYEESKHGINFFANESKMNMGNTKWVVGEDYWAAPTCSTCHMSATRKQPVTHDIGARISWNNRPELSIRTDAADAKMKLPGASLPWQQRRTNMQDVCLNCHDKTWVDNFYIQYDAVVELYNSKFAKPGKDLYALAQPLMSPVQFANETDWTWYELWHHEGRRARHGAAMMAPDYTHWHGTYEVAKRFYKEYIPELTALAERYEKDAAPEKAKAAQALKAKLESVLKASDHNWYIGQMDPEEASKRKAAQEEFKARYEKR